MAVALAEAAIQAGQAACFMTAHDLVSDLGDAYREGRLERRMRVYLAPKVPVIDETGKHHPDLEQELRRLGIDLRRSNLMRTRRP